MTRRQRAGSALLIALWALLVLSAAMFAWVQFIEHGIAVTREANLGLDARALARSGVAIAMHPKVTRQTPLLVASMGPDRGYKVTLTGEAAKLNLNYLLSGDERGNRLELLRLFLAGRGLDVSETARLIDCMLDWIDGDNVKHLNGAEEEPGYRPPNRGRLFSLDEIRKIRGSEPLVSQPGWQDDFTLFTNPGLIDLQFAGVDVIEALPGVGEARARMFVQMRQGPDKTESTEDDKIFKNVNEALSLLGITSSAQGSLLGELVTVNHPTVHIRSVGQAGKVYRQVEVVAQKVGGTLFSWKEN